MNAKPILERAEFERLDAPEQGATINLRVGDDITIKEVRDDIVKVSVARTVASNPECIFKIYVEMSADVQVDKKQYDELANAKEFFKRSPVARMLAAHIAAIIVNLTTNSAIGPLLTPPMVQI